MKENTKYEISAKSVLKVRTPSGSRLEMSCGKGSKIDGFFNQLLPMMIHNYGLRVVVEKLCSLPDVDPDKLKQLLEELKNKPSA